MKTQAASAPPLPKEVLIAEDSATQAAVLKIALEKHGWRVRVAGDGIAAMEQARLSKPDIVVSDIRMPKMDGYALSRAIKTDPALRTVPVVLFTSLSQAHDIVDAINSGADYYFLKQWDHDILIAKIANVLDTYQPVPDHGQDGLRVRLEGETYTIEANAQRPLTLLLSTYEIAIQQSMALVAARDQLREANESLEEAVRDRTAQFIASEIRYRRLFEAAKDGILILDAETGMVVDVNPYLAGLLGFSHEIFLGKTIWELGFLKDIIANRDNFLELQQKGYVRYEHLPLERKDGSSLDVEVVSNAYLAGDKKVIQCNIRDITERCVKEKQQKLAMQVLATLNRENDVALLVKDILHLIKEGMGFEAVGIRLREGDDFPYCETNGFAGSFVETERHLCARNASGDFIRDAAGNPLLECMCGNVICGRFDPSKPFFTERGSFWTNSTTGLLTSTTETDRQSRTRNRCHGEGYESVALVPLRAADNLIGILQINDRRKGMFTLDMIQFFEGMGASIGIALARKQAGEKVQSLARFPAENPSPVLRVDSAGAVLYANSASGDLLRQWGIAVGGPAPKLWRTLVNEALADGNPRTVEAEDDGRVFSITVAPVVREGYANLYANDITERRQAEEERQRMQAQLVHAQKLESIGTLASGVAHEINNPIMGIMNYAQLIRDRLGPDSPVSEYAIEIGRETERVATIVRNLLSFARQDKETHSPARLCDIVGATLSLIGSVARHDQIALKVDVPEDLPQIKCRSQQIQQVVMNLLTNARDALNEKYPGHDANKQILITSRRIERDGHQWIRTTVEDHGPGISEDVQRRMFEPFFTTKPRDKGTGLGLSISHGIVKDHGGQLSVESELGQWTRFHIDLPTDNGWKVE